MEGWIVGLRMVCMGLHRHGNPRTYLAGLKGDNAQIHEYLLQQVLSLHSPALQDCLLNTSILDRFCAPLCDVLFTPAGDGESDAPGLGGERFLRSLGDANLFTVSLSAGGEWLRYHHFFQQLLQNQLRSQRSPEEIAELHLRASKWFESEDQLPEAAGDFSLAAGQRHVLNMRAAADALAGLALTRQLMHEDEAATEALDLLKTFADEHNDPAYLPIVDSCRARLALLRGELDWAIHWACSFDAMPAAVELAMWLEVPVLTQARVLIADGSVTNLARAAGLLRVVRQQAEACHYVPQVIEATVLQSLLLEKQDRPEEALDLLSQAVALAEPGGWIRPFVEIGQAMAGMLAQLPDDRRETRFVRQIQSAFGCVDERPTPEGGAHLVEQPLIEALTNREHDVLVLLSQRLYDKEIARQLNISATTIRTHLTHLYEKLGVKNRRQAVLKAKESGIL